MTYTWIPPFSRKVEGIEKVLPSREVLTRCIGGLKRQARHESDPDKKYRLEVIRKEIEDLRRSIND